MALTRLDAARNTVQAMVDLGHVEPVDAALINEFLACAADLDDLDPITPHYASLVRAYTAIEAKVHQRLNRARDDGPHGPATVADLFAAMGDETPT